jgi:hypothetical protein
MKWGIIKKAQENLLSLRPYLKDERTDLQGFPKFLAGGEFRRFKIKQIELIREIQKIPTTLISKSFWTKILPLNLH